MYPEAKMIDAMKVWKLPAGKEDMLSQMCSSGDYFLEEKIDGYWYEFEKTENYSYLFSRNVSVTTGALSEKGANVPHIMQALDCLPKNTIIIGEIYYPGGTSKTVTTIMGCLPELAIKRQENKPIHYYLHDIIEYDGVNLIECGAEERYNILAKVWKLHNLSQYDFLRLAVKVDTELETEISRILANGGEGAVLKKRDYPYVPGKRPAWSTIKIKQMDTIDLVCMGFCDATKEYTGKELEVWPYWEGYMPVLGIQTRSDVCQYGEEGWVPVTRYYYLGWKTAIEVGAYNEEGQLVKIGTVSSGLSDEIKQDMTKHPENYLGRVCELDCMSIDRKEHTVRHPAFKMWRDDKNAQECTIKESFGT